MKNRRILSLRDTWNLFKSGSVVRPPQYSIYEVGMPNAVNFVELFSNTDFSGLSQYSYPQILNKYPFFEEVNNQWKQKAHLTDLVDSLWATHSESFCCFFDYDEDASASDITNKEKDAVKKFYSTLFSILDDTWDKYDMMLKIYEDNKSKLLDKVKTLVIGDNSKTIEGETTGSRSGTNSGTTTNTSTTTYNTKDEDDGTEERTGTNTHTTTHNTADNITINDDTSGSDVSEVEYDSQVENRYSKDTRVETDNKVKNTPQLDILPSDNYNSEVGNSLTTTEDGGTSTDTRTGTDTTTTTYGKEIDRTEAHTKTGTETLQDAINETLTIDKEHKKTGTEAVSASGSSSTTDSESTSGTTSTTESGDMSTTTQEDRDTLMARIDEIDKKYKLLVQDWAKEFRSLFWEVVDYE